MIIVDMTRRSPRDSFVRHKQQQRVLILTVCVFTSHSFWTRSSLDVPAAGVTQEEGHTGFLIHLLSAVRALIFLARRIQPYLMGLEIQNS